MPIYAALACLRDVRNELKTGDPRLPDAVNDPLMIGFLRMATQRLQQKLYPFVPYVDTKVFDDYSWTINTGYGLLRTPVPFVSLSNVTDGDSNVLAIGSAVNYYPLGGKPPYRELQLNAANQPFSTLSGWNRRSSYGYSFSGTALTGVWGVHTDWANAFMDSGDVVAVPMDAVTRSLTVGSVNNPDFLGRYPRFSPLQMLQIDSEWIGIMSANPTTNVLTVQRGINGTTAVPHTVNTMISIFEPMDDLRQATVRWAAYPYKRRGDYSKQTFDGMVAITFPADAPPDVFSIIQQYNGVY